MTALVKGAQDEFIRVFTSGGLVVPEAPEQTRLRLYVSNLSTQQASFSFRFNLLADTEKQLVVSGAAAIPGQGAATIEINPALLGLAGQAVEAVAELPTLDTGNGPSFQLHPSLVLFEAGPGGIVMDPIATAVTGDFNEVEEVPTAAPVYMADGVPRSVPSNLFALTWGLFDIPVAMLGTTTEVSLWLTSLSNQPETAQVTVSRLMPGSTVKQPVLSEQVTVPAGQARQIPILGVEGMAIEPIVEIPFAAPPLVVLPLLTPSVTVNRRNTSTGELETVLFISPGQALFADR